MKETLILKTAATYKRYKIMKTYVGKEEKINGVWYPVVVKAESYKEAVKKLYVGQKKSYGTVEEIRGRFYEDKF